MISRKEVLPELPPSESSAQVASYRAGTGTKLCNSLPFYRLLKSTTCVPESSRCSSEHCVISYILSGKGKSGLNKIGLKFSGRKIFQFVIFKPLTNCFKETIGFDVKASFVSRP